MESIEYTDHTVYHQWNLHNDSPAVFYGTLLIFLLVVATLAVCHFYLFDFLTC